MSLGSLSMRNIDPVPPGYCNSFRMDKMTRWPFVRPSCGGHRRPGLFFQKETWLVMSLSGAISPLDMAVCMTWTEQSNEASQSTPCTPGPQDTSWESGPSSLESVMQHKTKSWKKLDWKETNWCWRKSLETIRRTFFYTDFICSIRNRVCLYICVTAFSILRDKYMFRGGGEAPPPTPGHQTKAVW